jgi:RHS repeat-associated protein
MPPVQKPLLGDFGGSVYHIKKEFDEEGGVNGAGGIDAYYFGARMYDPSAGVWMSTDPAEEFWNSYSYVGGNTINFIDPFGLQVSEVDQERMDELGDMIDAAEREAGRLRGELSRTSDTEKMQQLKKDIDYWEVVARRARNELRNIPGYEEAEAPEEGTSVFSNPSPLQTNAAYNYWIQGAKKTPSLLATGAQDAWEGLGFVSDAMGSQSTGWPVGDAILTVRTILGDIVVPATQDVTGRVSSSYSNTRANI